MSPTDPLSPPALPRRPSHLARRHTQELSDADAAHLSTPGPSTGSFSTLEVRSRSQRAGMTSRDIAFPRGNYDAPPNVAGGFKMLDLAAGDAEEVPAVRANLVGSDISNEGFRVALETWEGGVMYAGAATWIEHRAGARECHFGQFDSMDVEGDEPARVSRKRRRAANETKTGFDEDGMQVEGRESAEPQDDSEPDSDSDPGSDDPSPDPLPQRYTVSSTFPVRFPSPPSVICWLNRLDMPTGPGRNFRVRASASNVTRASASFCLETWGPGDSVLSGAAMCWIAFPAQKKNVDSGSFNTMGSSDGSSGSDSDSNSAAAATTDDDDDDEAAGGSVRRIEMYEAEQRAPRTTGRVRFRARAFERVPTVLVALNMLDLAGDADLRIRVEVEDVDREGFTWRLESWGDSTMYAGGASWIALGFV